MSTPPIKLSSYIFYSVDITKTLIFLLFQHHDEQMIKLLIDYGADIGVALCMVGLNRPSLYHKARYEEMLNAPTIGYLKSSICLF